MPGEDAQQAGGAVRRIVMGGVVGVIEDLAQPVGVGALQQGDVGPPAQKPADNLDVLVGVLMIEAGWQTQGTDVAGQAAFVGVALAVPPAVSDRVLIPRKYFPTSAAH